MTSTQVNSKTLRKNVGSVSTKLQRGRLSLKSKVEKPTETLPHPIPYISKKPFTLKEKELLEACESGDIDAVYSKLWDKANVNCKRPVYGSTPLAVACRKGHPKIVNVLLEFGASMSSDEFGCSPLHWAANSGNPQIINSLIKKAHLSIDELHKKDQYGSTALHFASVNNLAETVQTLIAAGSNPNIKNNDGRKASDLTSDPDIRGILIEREQKLEQISKAVKQTKKKGKSIKLKPMAVSKALVKPASSLPQLREKTVTKTNSVKSTKPQPKPPSPKTQNTVMKTALVTKAFTPN